MGVSSVHGSKGRLLYRRINGYHGTATPQVEQVLPQDERGTYVASLNSPHTGVTSMPCVISGDGRGMHHMISYLMCIYTIGFPVLRDKIEFRKLGFAANKDDWNRLLMTTKVCYPVI